MADQLARLALYWTPERAHPLWERGCAWLGRDPEDASDGTSAIAPTPTRAATTEPRRYGFHATLKAPMRLRPGADEASFLEAARTFASSRPSFEMPALQVGVLEHFIALLPREPIARDHPLHRIADDCVRTFDPWRAPMDEAARTQREAKSPLSASQREMLRQWGYPHVMAEWRFHLTLSDPLASADQQHAMRHDARAFFAGALAEPLRFASICVFRERSPGAPFALIRRFPLG